MGSIFDYERFREQQRTKDKQEKRRKRKEDKDRKIKEDRLERQHRVREERKKRKEAKDRESRRQAKYAALQVKIDEDIRKLREEREKDRSDEAKEAREAEIRELERQREIQRADYEEFAARERAERLKKPDQRDRGLAIIRRDWLHRIMDQQASLSEPPEPPEAPGVPEWTGAGDDAFAILVHPREYIYHALNWKPIEAAPPGSEGCKTSRDDSYKFSAAATVWDNEYPAWINELLALAPIALYDLDIDDLWRRISPGFDRSEWMPGRVSVADLQEIGDDLAGEIETVKRWNADWFAYLLEAQNHGGGLTSNDDPGPIMDLYGCGLSQLPGPLPVYEPTGRPDDPTGVNNWNIFKGRVEETAEALAKVPPAAKRAVDLLERLKAAIRPFRHGTHFKFRGE